MSKHIDIGLNNLINIYVNNLIYFVDNLMDIFDFIILINYVILWLAHSLMPTSPQSSNYGHPLDSTPKKNYNPSFSSINYPFPISHSLQLAYLFNRFPSNKQRCELNRLHHLCQIKNNNEKQVINWIW